MLSINPSLSLFIATNRQLFWSVMLDVGSCFQIARVQFISRCEMGLGIFLRNGQTEPGHHFCSPDFQKCTGLSAQENQNDSPFQQAAHFPFICTVGSWVLAPKYLTCDGIFSINCLNVSLDTDPW